MIAIGADDSAAHSFLLCHAQGLREIGDKFGDGFILDGKRRGEL